MAQKQTTQMEQADIMTYFPSYRIIGPVVAVLGWNKKPKAWPGLKPRIY